MFSSRPNKYLARHNDALKVLYFELIQELQLVESLPAWYSPIKPNNNDDNNNNNNNNNSNNNIFF